MTPWSVSPRAGCSKAAARSARASMRQAPSSTEYSECTWRWTQGDCGTKANIGPRPAPSVRSRRAFPLPADLDRGGLHRDPLRPAVAAEHLLDPAEAAPVAKRLTEALERLREAVVRERTLRRAHHRVEERRGRQVRNAEAIAHQVVAVPELRLQAVEPGEDFLPRLLGPLLAACPEPEHGEEASRRAANAAQT